MEKDIQIAYMEIQEVLANYTLHNYRIQKGWGHVFETILRMSREFCRQRSFQ
jgi:hypothetical protein